MSYGEDQEVPNQTRDVFYALTRLLTKEASLPEGMQPATCNLSDLFFFQSPVLKDTYDCYSINVLKGQKVEVPSW